MIFSSWGVRGGWRTPHRLLSFQDNKSDYLTLNVFSYAAECTVAYKQNWNIIVIRWELHERQNNEKIRWVLFKYVRINQWTGDIPNRCHKLSNSNKSRNEFTVFFMNLLFGNRHLQHETELHRGSVNNVTPPQWNTECISILQRTINQPLIILRLCNFQ